MKHLNTSGAPDLDKDYSIPPGGGEEYREQGHIYLAGVAQPDEVAFYRQAIRQATANHDIGELPPLEQRDTYGQAFLQYMNLWRHDELTRKFVMARRFGKIAAELMGVDGVRLYHDQALFKEPGGGHTPWHQDHYYWPVDTDNTITMWMPLVDIDRDMGMLTFASGSHSAGRPVPLPISDESEEVLDRYVRDQGYEIIGRDSMRAGDATFHSGWTLHSAPPNNSKQMREVMTIIYIEAGCRVREPENENQRLDIERWMPGLQTGDLVDSRLNPVVWSVHNNDG